MNTHQRSLFKKRCLDLDQFLDVCKAVKLFQCDKDELEQYEKDGLLLPVARLILPADYRVARDSKKYRNIEFSAEIMDKYSALDKLYDSIPPISPHFREEAEFPHPIDLVTEDIEQLIRPSEQEFVPWSDYETKTEIPVYTKGVIHFYQPWQVFALYEIRTYEKNLYPCDLIGIHPRDLETGKISELTAYFEATSQFYFVRQALFYVYFDKMPTNDDGRSQLDEDTAALLEAKLVDLAQQLTSGKSLTKDNFIKAITGMCILHSHYTKVEKVTLAEVMKDEIWKAIRFCDFAFGLNSQEISDLVGAIHKRGREKPYIEAIFPDERKVKHENALSELGALSQNYNQNTPTWQINESEIEELLNFLEASDLAVFEYIIVQVKETHFNYNQWQVAEAFLQIKILASFLESFLRLVCKEGGKTITDTDSLRNFMEKIVPNSAKPIWNKFEKCESNLRNNFTGKTFNANTSNFVSKFQLLRQVLPKKPNDTVPEEEYLGACLTIALLTRNFTSHHTVEQEDILQGRYTWLVRSVVNTIFLAWMIARKENWV